MKFVCVNLDSETSKQYFDLKIKLKSYGELKSDISVDNEELNSLIFLNGLLRMIKDIEQKYGE